MSTVLRGFSPPTRTKNDLLDRRTTLSAVRYLTSLTGSNSAISRWLSIYYPLLAAHVADTNDPHRVSDIDLTDDILAGTVPLLNDAGNNTTIVSTASFTPDTVSAIDILARIRDLVLSLYVYEVTTAVGTVVYTTGRDWGMFESMTRSSSETVSGTLDTFSDFLSTVVIAPDNLNAVPQIPSYPQIPLAATFYESYLMPRNAQVDHSTFVLDTSTLDAGALNPSATLITLDDVPYLTLQVIFHIPTDTDKTSQQLLVLGDGKYSLTWYRYPNFRVALCDNTNSSSVVELASVLTNEGHVILDVDVMAGTVSLHGDLHSNVKIPTSWTVLTLQAKNTDGTVDDSVSFFIANVPEGMTFDATTGVLTSDGTLGSGELIVTATDSDGKSDQFTIPYNAEKSAPASQEVTVDIPTSLIGGWSNVDYGVPLGNAYASTITIQSLVIYQNELARARILSMIPTM